MSTALALKVPTPKFAKGDKVFFASTFMTKHSIPCPDCDGSGKWPITSPAGNNFTISCARCRYDYGSRTPELSLSWPTFVGNVKELTVGSVRIDTDSDRPISYMCTETGVGSGSVYYECDFYADKETALKAADGKAQAANLTHTAVKTQALEVLPYVHLTYENAVEEAYHVKWRELNNRISYLIDDLGNVEAVEDIPATIERFKKCES